MTERHEPRYFPAQCPFGHRPFLALIPPGDDQTRHLTCPSCGAGGRVIPGAYYTAATRERFETVASVLYEARLTRDQTSTLVAWLDRAARDSEGAREAVVNALSKVPGLGALAAIVPSSHHERHGFVGLLLALAIAGTTTAMHRISGERPLMPPTDGRDDDATVDPGPELEQHVG